jgi:hypothetical protein
MSAQKFETFLAKLYVDDKARSRFVADPRREGLKAGLSADDCAALENIDFVGLELAADSFARKRTSCPPRKSVSNLMRWLTRRFYLTHQSVANRPTKIESVIPP